MTTMTRRMTTVVGTAAVLAVGAAPGAAGLRGQPLPGSDAGTVSWSTARARHPGPPPVSRIGESQPDSLYRTAREALNRGQHVRAAGLFRELRRRYPDSGYTGDALYFEAFALYRTGSEDNLERAQELLDRQAEAFPEAPTREDARSLRVRIRGALARRGDVEAWSEIQEQASAECGEEDQETRLMALSALQNMDAERAAPILQEVLTSRGDCSAKLRKRAVFLLAQRGTMSDEAVEILLDLAHRNPDPDPEVREAAVFWLSRVDSEEAVDALSSILLGAEDAETRGRALFALSQQDSRRSVEVLREFARRSDAPTDLRARAIFWLGQQGHAAGLDFVRSIYPELGSEELKEKVLFTMGQVGGEEGHRWLAERARDRSENPELRANAVFWLGQSGVSSDVLMEIYHSLDEPEVRGQVLFALSQQDSEEAVEGLLEIAREEEDPELRERAVFWLGQSDDPRVQEFLLDLIRGGGSGGTG